MTRASDRSQKDDFAALDPELVRRAQQGDRKAQQTIVETSYDYVQSLLYRLVGGSQDVEDLRQAALVRILTVLPTYRFEGAFKSWVAGVVVFITKQYFDRKRIQRARSFETTSESLLQISSPEDLHGRADARQLLRLCDDALAKMSDAQRTAFVLRHVEGYAVKEVATIMNAAQSTTRLRLYYARKIFVATMRERLGDDALRLGAEEAEEP